MDIETVVALLTKPRQSEFTFDYSISSTPSQTYWSLNRVGKSFEVGLQQQTVGGIYTFVIASNEVIPNSTLEYARDLVADLQSLGSHFSDLRKGVAEDVDDNIQASNTSVSEGELERESSPCMDENRFPIHLQTMVATFRAKICLFALPKQHLQKPWGATTRGQAFVDFVGTLPSSSQHRELQIIRRYLLHYSLDASNGEASLLDDLSEVESPGFTLRKRFDGKQNITCAIH
ncbi:hypothetical protein BDBG_03936 [Blastomyces gilchristii SLH14081]|uniref:Uncharacterized protein n=1 Tax=Blastomyces gilchristii (strain SLH14081) TaxID=559298 RepID=A0A179UL14_BLAGS|nr:uncharacterized protein BDBG_03936 [Blastomyces gilchristii SLH14081]OAT07928.1 hypothetical protein BDBG_03936 [Blastomyces gilchristii SLH14081]